eukprot:4870688-Lingulodinium_polyedra.AAC.1
MNTRLHSASSLKCNAPVIIACVCGRVVMVAVLGACCCAWSPHWVPVASVRAVCWGGRGAFERAVACVTGLCCGAPWSCARWRSGRC